MHGDEPEGRTMSSTEHKFDQGDKLTDTVTGFTGTVTGITLFYNGCIQYLLSPPATDGKMNDGAWIDEQQLELVEPKEREAPAGRTGGGFRSHP
jgi:hypothetical protein